MAKQNYSKAPMRDTSAACSSKNAGNSKAKNSFRKSKQSNNRRDSKGTNVADPKDRFAMASAHDAWNGANDPRWYNQFTAGVKNYANFNFYAPVGSEVQLSPDDKYNDDRFPGVMALYFCPSFGTKLEGNASMLNLAANRLYQFTRFENNGSSRYDRGDLMLYFLSMDSCYMFHAWLKRIYGTMTQFSSMNRYMPRTLLRAERVDYDDLETNLADVRAWINQFGEKLSILPIPKSMAYMARHSWMANSLFVDTDTRKCQFYMYVPQYFCKFNIADGTGTLPAGVPWLQYDNPSFGNNALTFAQLQAFGSSLIQPLIENEDFNLIGADVIKAFGSEGVVKIDPIPDDYKTVPLYSEEVLDQIQNATAIGHPACYGSTLLPAQNNGAAVYWDGATNSLVPNDEVWIPFDTTQTYQIPYSGFQLRKVVNFEKDDITNDDVMVATRLTNCLATPTTIIGNDGLSYYKATCHSVGSEFVCQYSMFFFTDSDSLGHRIGNTVMGYFVHPEITTAPHGDATDSGATWAANALAAQTRNEDRMRDLNRFLMCLSQFKRHPYVFLTPMTEFVYVDAQGDVQVQGLSASVNSVKRNSRYFGDTANFATFTIADLRDLANVALQSEFYVPLTASGAVTVGSL